MPELPTLSKLENHVTELKYVRCRNSRLMPELPTVETPDPQGFGKLAVGLWSCIPDTSGMTRTVNPPSQLKCETSELPTLAGTPDRRNSRRTNPRTTISPLLDKYRTRPVSISDTSGIARPAKIKLALLSLKYSKLTWVGLSTYETLSINMRHPS